jgi:hypothetical protein
MGLSAIFDAFPHCPITGNIICNNRETAKNNGEDAVVVGTVSFHHFNPENGHLQCTFQDNRRWLGDRLGFFHSLGFLSFDGLLRRRLFRSRIFRGRTLGRALDGLSCLSFLSRIFRFARHSSFSFGVVADRRPQEARRKRFAERASIVLDGPLVQR